MSSYVQFWNDADGTYYRVNFTLQQSVLSKSTGAITGATEYYLLITTTMTYPDRSKFPTFLVRTLNDVPPGDSAATDFSDLCRKYINYFINNSKLLETSSNSSSSKSLSSNSSSSSSKSSNSSSSKSLSSNSSNSSLSSHH